MKLIDAEDFVRSIRDEDGAFMVSFENHACYFKVLLSDRSNSIIAKIIQALDSKATLNFSYDEYLNIVKAGG